MGSFRFCEYCCGSLSITCIGSTKAEELTCISTNIALELYAQHLAEIIPHIFIEKILHFYYQSTNTLYE
jgi:hypothetical protein